MATYYSSTPFPVQFHDNGTPAASYVLHAFLDGGSTPTNMFTDSGGTSAGTTITLDSQGYPSVSGSRVVVWLDELINYRFELRDATDVTVVWTSNEITKISKFTLAADYAAIRALTSASLNDGDVITVTDPLIAGTFVVKTGTVTDNGGTLIVFTDDSNRYAEREYNGAPSISWFYSGDIGADINALTAAGTVRIYVPAGSYTQSTAFTTDQELYLFSDYWDVFGTPPATITKDANITHIKTNGPFTSLGIKYDGNSVAGGADGIEVNGKFHFIGQVVNQTGNGFVIAEELAGDNLNNSIIGGAFSGNTEAQLLIHTEHINDSADLDTNTIQFYYCRCNSGRFGLVVRGGLYNDYQYVNTKGNSEIGILIEADNAIVNNTFRIFSEQSVGGSLDFYAVDGWTAFGGAPTRTSDTTFTLTGDQTATFVAGGKIRLTDNGVDYYGTIDSAVFTSLTTVTVTVAGSVALTANLTAVATDKANNNFRDNDFVHARGLTKDDIYIENGNVFLAAGSRQGIFTNAEQPWVKAYVNGDKSNVTGNGTVYTVAFDAEIKDTQGNFDTSTFTYTAPATGRYKFNGSIRLQGLSGGSHTRCEINLVTSNRTYNLHDCNLDNVKATTNSACLGFSVAADMDSNDTATVTVEVTGAGVDDVDVSGASGQTWLDVVLEG